MVPFLLLVLLLDWVAGEAGIEFMADDDTAFADSVQCNSRNSDSKIGVPKREIGNEKTKAMLSIDVRVINRQHP